MKNIAEKMAFVRSKLNRYWIAVIIGLVLTFLTGEHTIFNRMDYNRQIRELKKDIKYYSEQKEQNLQKLQELHSDNESLEKLAREQYQMVKPDEELFLIKE
jgi:cell division protein FtsB